LHLQQNENQEVKESESGFQKMISNQAARESGERFTAELADRAFMKRPFFGFHGSNILSL